MREEGYYWVKHEGNWMVAQWYISPNKSYTYWFMTGDEDERSDDYFQEIDENRITRKRAREKNAKYSKK